MPKVLVMNKSFIFVTLLVPLITGFSSRAIGADVLDNWQWRNPRTGTAISAATYGAGRFVLAGEAGAILVSADASNWTTYNTGSTNSARGLIYAGGQFLLVGDSGLIASSPDGAVWTTLVSGTTTHLKGVAYGDGVFVAVGSGGKVMTSTNGQNWTTQNSGTSVSLDGIAYGNGVFVATPQVTFFGAFVFVSTNGIDWTYSEVAGASGLNGIVFGKGMFVAGGHRYAGRPPFSSGFFYTSTNGTTWTEQFIGSGISKTITVGEHFVGQLSGVYVSADGANWARTLDGMNVLAGAYGAGRYVLIGGDNSLITGSDGTNWVVNTPVAPRKGDGLSVDTATDIAYGNGVYVAAGGFYPNSSVPAAGALISTDGRRFDLLPDYPAVSRLIFAKGNFLAVGTNGLLLRSADGGNWSRRNANTDQHLSGITVGNGTLVAVGNSGTIITSPDGLVWTRRFSPTANHLFGITWESNRFVAVGNSGTIITSSDGANWSVEYADTLNPLLHVAAGNGLFVATGVGGIILTSPDGSTWTTRINGIGGATLYSVSYGNGKFIITGTPVGPTDRSNVLLTSTNGVDWIRRNPGTHEKLYGAAFINGSFWILGSAGAILESVQIPPITLFARSTSEGVELTSSGGESGRVYELQSCTNALGSQWRHLDTFTNGPDAYRFVDPVEHAHSFYRLTSP